METAHVVIMAGGRGERFWPASRLRCPKHLLPIVGETPMLQQTLDRLPEEIPASRQWIITNAEQAETVAEVCPQLPADNIVSEPIGRDTAPAVGLAALLLHRHDPEAILALLPADAVIHDHNSLRHILRNAFELAGKEEIIATIGIPPTYAATGYGYIHRGSSLGQSFEAFHVKRFVEKPDQSTAEGYLSSGEYLWNAGMFIFKASLMLEELRNFQPELHAGLMKIGEGLDAGEGLPAILKRIYPELTKISIDYAVMEKSSKVVTLPATFDWDDVGEWPAVARHFPSDDNGNTCRGESCLLDSANNLVISEKGHVISLIGVSDLIVVHTPDATLICPRDRAQEIKQLAQAAQKQYPHLT